jgi:nucleoside-diphosphate-sugar epimerase
MKILVTGASGFVGRGLTKSLQDAGHEVVAAVRSSTVALPPGIELRLVGELESSTVWEPALTGVNAVVHLAGLAHVTRGIISADQARRFQQINVEGTRRLAEECRKCGIKKFIFLSSLHAVTSQSDLPITEVTPPHPDSAYGQSKLKAEMAVREVLNSSATAWTILRPPLVYGIGQKANLQKLTRAIQRGWLLPFGALKNRRSLMGLDNLCHLVGLCLTDDRANGQIFLCSDGRLVSTPELIRLIAGACGRNPVLFSLPEPILKFFGRLPGLGALAKLADSLYVDDRHVRETLSWRPPLTMEAGLERATQSAQ